MSRLKVILLVALIAILASLGIVLLTRWQTVNVLESEKQKPHDESENHYGVVRYQAFADFKISSRRKQFRIGDLIPFELSMRNKSPNQVRLLDIDIDNKFIVRDSQGNKIDVFSYSSFQTISPSFTIFNSGDGPIKNLRYFVGCDSLSQLAKKEAESGNDGVPLVRDGCFKIKHLGKYSVSVQVSNNFVQSGHPIQTAVGEIETTPFEITIIE